MAASWDILTAVLQNGVTAMNNISKSLANAFPQVTGTSTSATAGTCTLTSSQPAGFLTVVSTSGNTIKIPYYDP